MAAIMKIDIPETSGLFEVSLPINGEILHVDTQYNHPKMWVKVPYIVYDKWSFRMTKFFLAETGKEFDDTNMQYIATIYLYAGTQVFHLFKVIN